MTLQSSLCKRPRLPIILIILPTTICCHSDWHSSLSHKEGLDVGKLLSGLEKLLSIVGIIGEIDSTSGTSDNRSLFLLLSLLLSLFLVLDLVSWLSGLGGVGVGIARGPAAGGNAHLVGVQGFLDSWRRLSVTVKVGEEDLLPDSKP
jgi:opacity protein-like surface antigen